MWEEVVGASLWISEDFQWIWMDFLHVDLQLYLYYLQGISRRQVLVSRVAFIFLQKLRLAFLGKFISFSIKICYLLSKYVPSSAEYVHLPILLWE